MLLCLININDKNNKSIENKFSSIVKVNSSFFFHKILFNTYSYFQINILKFHNKNKKIDMSKYRYFSTNIVLSKIVDTSIVLSQLVNLLINWQHYSFVWFESKSKFRYFMILRQQHNL